LAAEHVFTSGPKAMWDASERNRKRKNGTGEQNTSPKASSPAPMTAHWRLADNLMWMDSFKKNDIC
jgi:hypothetical protein